MSKTLATAVHLTDDSGIVHSFLTGTTPPKWARKQITNPKAWVESDETDEDEVADGSGDESPDESGEGAGESEDAPAGGEVEIPRKNGSTDAWRAYADSKGFETDEDITRGEIIAALEAAGIPTE